LRDCLLGRPRLDFDFAVSKNAVALARSFSKKIRGAFVLLDKEHGCARVVRCTESGASGAARSRHSLKTNGGSEKQLLTFDFADFRDKTIEKDLSHRDFTINTLAVELKRDLSRRKLSHMLIDKKNAVKDLKSRVIRMASSTSFKEDPLRLLRAFSLEAELGFQIEKKTLAAIKKHKDLIRGVSYERIRDELFKIIETDRAAVTIRAMDRIGILERVIPQIRVMFGCTQGGYHHLDVWPHSLETLSQLEKVLKEFENNPEIKEYLDTPLAGERARSSILKFAALFHDIGKPETKKKENGRTSFHGHERVGKNIVKHIADLLKLSTKEKYALEDMVLWHLRPGYLGDFKNPSERAVYRYFRDTKEEGLSVLLLSLADQRATRGPLTSAYDQKHHEEIVRGLISRYLEKKKEKPFVRLINGNDLIRKLKLKPSPLFSKILTAVEEKQAMGDIMTKEEALHLSKKIASAGK